MTIPNDPLLRWWVDASATNPLQVNAFRPSLLALMAFGPGREPRFAGTGFIIAGSSGASFAITAKHVLTEGVVPFQRPMPAYAPSSQFIPDRLTRPSIDPEKLKIVWMGSQHAGMLNVLHANYNDVLDISLFVIAPQEQHAQPFHPTTIPLDIRAPKVGDVIHMVSLVDMRVSEIVEPADQTGMGQMISLNRRVSIRVGVVTAVHPSGFRQYKWPCFTTSIPAEAGMSGGFVYLPSDGKTIAACGVVSADNSTDEARIDWNKCGESVIASAWPALALSAPNSIPSTPETPTRTLYHFMLDGDMDAAVGGIENLEVTLKPGTQDCSIGFKASALR